MAENFPNLKGNRHPDPRNLRDTIKYIQRNPHQGTLQSNSQKSRTKENF